MRIPRALGICILLFSASISLAATRHYYITAEDVSWSYAPSHHNLLNGSVIRQPWSLKLEWPKTRFIEYTDDTFTTRKPQPEWLGILGPVIRAEVGDEIVVEFLNRGSRVHDIHPHGVRYDKDNEGSPYLPKAKGGYVAPGARYTYHWFATKTSGPGPGQPSSIVWWYHGHVDPAIEINAGLLGPIVITAKGKDKPEASPKDVDREFVASFMIFDQMGGKLDGLFYAINGFIFGNLPGLAMKQGEKVRWYMLGMGNEIDLHTPHWHGETVTYGGQNTDVIELLPGSMKTVDMIADNPGTWMFHCHVEDHMEGGMMAVYMIYAPPTRPCPVAIREGDFWKADKFKLTVKNNSAKAIKSLTVASETFLAPQDLRLPFNAQWTFPQILPGHEETAEKPALRAESAHSILGWVFFPSSIQYEDGTTWQPEQEGECFSATWQDPQHPELLGLPPRQIEMKPD